ncbi:MAG: DNA repair protein RadA [Ignavibacteria bacterium]|nr:DNA repair protein RadA [Ignavibacteria bacterium]
MKSQKSVFICSSCAHESLKWLGKCPQCGSWNSFVEEKVEPKAPKGTVQYKGARPTKLKDITYSNTHRLLTGTGELDRVLGGGFMPGSIILLGGDPGIGKSTLILQAASKLLLPVLYVSGEESAQQIKLRADRLGVDSEHLLLLAETELNAILQAIDEYKPSLVVIDSIQTTFDSNLDNSPGAITQLRECTSRLMDATKKNGFTTLLIGHITKEGTIAGPKILEHIVDTVIMFEGDSSNSYRILRAQKNRFGSTNEIGVFEMLDTGLREVQNPSELFIGERTANVSGSVITCTMEGTRPILLEIQGLVTPSHFGSPQRVSNGFDYRRLSILLAVLEKRNGLRLSNANVFLNITGGVRVDEPAIDLPVCCAIASNLLEKRIDPSVIVIGETGLGGEIRSISNIDKRLQEAERIGFTKVVIPSRNVRSITYKGKLKILGVDNLQDALKHVLIQ